MSRRFFLENVLLFPWGYSSCFLLEAAKLVAKLLRPNLNMSRFTPFSTRTLVTPIFDTWKVKTRDKYISQGNLNQRML